MVKIARLVSVSSNLRTFELEATEDINIEKLLTISGGDFTSLFVGYEFDDPRNLSVKQRKFYRALLSNIYHWSGHTTDILHELFKEYFYYIYGKRISTAGNSKNSMTEMNMLLDLVIDFIFEHRVPFRTGYELLPKNEAYYLYNCCKHRKCAICGSHADIHHEGNKVGMGNNRNAYDHTESTFIALCRRHHTERHATTWELFKEEHFLEAVKLDGELLVKLGLMTKRRWTEVENK